MGFYNWSMRRASMILFIVSAAIFLLGVGQALLSLQNLLGIAVAAGRPMIAGWMPFVMLLSGFFMALVAASVPFLGAVLIHRWDHRGAA